MNRHARRTNEAQLRKYLKAAIRVARFKRAEDAALEQAKQVTRAAYRAWHAGYLDDAGLRVLGGKP